LRRQLEEEKAVGRGEFESRGQLEAAIVIWISIIGIPARSVQQILFRSYGSGVGFTDHRRSWKLAEGGACSPWTRGIKKISLRWWKEAVIAVSRSRHSRFNKARGLLLYIINPFLWCSTSKIKKRRQYYYMVSSPDVDGHVAFYALRISALGEMHLILKLGGFHQPRSGGRLTCSWKQEQSWRCSGSIPAGRNPSPTPDPGNRPICAPPNQAVGIAEND
jgi:hypothetical protein